LTILSSSASKNQSLGDAPGMNSAQDYSVDSDGHGPEPSRPLASWYTQGRSDGLGDRLLMFDNSGTASLELLRFRPEFAATFGFESALRERVEQLYRLQHPAFPRVHAVEFLDDGDALTLVSTHTTGKRLSDLFQVLMPRAEPHPEFATWLIGQLTSAAAELQAQGSKLAHGALSADRIVLTPDRRMIVVEHVLGSALALLELPATRLWSDVGIIALPSDAGPPQLDCRGDVVQIGLIALSVLLGRRVTPNDYPKHLDALLDEFSDTVGRRSPTLVAPLRLWLERALRTDGLIFRSAHEARDGLHELPGDIGRQAVVGAQRPEIVSLPDPQPPKRGKKKIAIVAAVEPMRTNDAVNTVAIDCVNASEQSSTATNAAYQRPVRRAAIARTLAVVFALLTIGEAVAIGRLLYARSAAAVPVSAPLLVESRDPGDVVTLDGQEVGVTPMELRAGSERHTIQIRHPDVPPLGVARALLAVDAPANPPAKIKSTSKVDPRTLSAIAEAAAHQRSGGLRLVSPIELQVLEGERVLGSSADGPVVTTAGRHEFDLVNNALGYRSQQTVEIHAGQIVSLSVSPPDGRVSINARPWAQVWIDGNLVGETPLANVSVPVGDHEIVFRHPQLGERRETTIVRSGGLTRVSAIFAR
jgi:PEGA domain-containing protein